MVRLGKAQKGMAAFERWHFALKLDEATKARQGERDKRCWGEIPDTTTQI